ncbi:hypothetical protein LTR86_001973 [Recurvomyces mirabilis]|nr:hypothetical protein LTR86_001973 [Recurvomyces mirabilis]
MAHTPWFAGKPRKKAKPRRRRSICLPLRTIYNEEEGTDSIALGIGASYIDPVTERDPPPPPTEVRFPVHELYSTTSWNSDNSAPQFRTVFGSILKPRGITKDHVEALNIEYASNQSLEELLPPSSDGHSYLPAVSADEACEITEYSDPRLSSTEHQRREQEFHSRLAELRIDNDTAYRTLARNFKNGIRGARLAHMRKLYEGLESMGRYWECDKDEYLESISADDEAGNERRVKRIRLDDQSSLQSETALSLSTSEARDREIPLADVVAVPYTPTDEQDITDADINNSSATTLRSSRSNDSSPEPRKRIRYQGRRTNTGTEMPDTFRSDTIKSFVEGIVWPFRCSVQPPRVMPLVQFGTLNVPVRQTAAVYRQADDRARARQGHLVGPLFTIQARAETSFGESTGNAAALGGLLQVAQERRREGRTEVKPGESKWWTTKPRFGGAYHDVAKSVDEIKTGRTLETTQGMISSKLLNSSPPATKFRPPGLAWEQLRCGSGHWDPKTTYMSIGKDPTSCHDEVE